MPAPTLESVWIAHPDVVSSAINLLVWALAVVGAILASVLTAMTGILVYIWRKMEFRLDKFAEALESLAKSVEHRMTAIESRCDERYPRK